jgi:simple sugar transport system substrate-binding protein
LVKWEQLYEDLLLKARSGEMENSQHWRLLHSGAVEMGSDWNEPVKPEFVDELKQVSVSDPVFGEISVYDLIMERMDQFKQLRVLHHPFTGPIRDTKGNLKLKEGEVLPQDDLRFTIQWYVDGIIPPA